jgi:hypothetical protein
VTSHGRTAVVAAGLAVDGEAVQWRAGAAALATPGVETFLDGEDPGDRAACDGCLSPDTSSPEVSVVVSYGRLKRRKHPDAGVRGRAGATQRRSSITLAGVPFHDVEAAADQARQGSRRSDSVLDRGAEFAGGQTKPAAEGGEFEVLRVLEDPAWDQHGLCEPSGVEFAVARKARVALHLNRVKAHSQKEWGDSLAVDLGVEVVDEMCAAGVQNPTMCPLYLTITIPVPLVGAQAKSSPPWSQRTAEARATLGKVAVDGRSRAGRRRGDLGVAEACGFQEHVAPLPGV